MTPELEARALALHQTRKANQARNYPWAEPLTFDGGERDFCLSEARNAIAEQARAASVIDHADAQYAALFATLSDADLAEGLARIDEDLAGLRYRPLTVDIQARGEWLRDERRRFVAERDARAVAVRKVA
jgi:hypothetical protein